MQRTGSAALAAAFAFGLSGCVTAEFKEPISDFTSSMSLANSAIGTYFAELNDYERDVYLETVLQDPALRVANVRADGTRTGLTPYFESSSIKARLDALSLLSTYGARLAALAGSDAPTRFNAGSSVLGENLKGLETTFRNLGATADGAPPKDPTAAQYVGPVSTIVGVFGDMILTEKRDQAVAAAITTGAPAVNTILNLLESDLASVVGPLQVTGTAQSLQGAVSYYNTNKDRMTYAEREASLKRIDTLAERYQAAISAQPSEAVDGIRDAHAALVEYAESPRRPEDMMALVAALETFNNRLKPVVESLNKLEDIGDD